MKFFGKEGFFVKIPDEVRGIISAFEENGFEAYAVGGCVRDALLGRNPGDYDIASSALPEETKRIFAGEKIIGTGIKHGTLTLFRNGKPFEITTFRVESEYRDHRRPEKVAFTKSLREDLSRRDFTVNAMAFSERTGIIDPFGGAEDLEKGIIRAVGEPEKRFGEDALRIMRALRFAAVLGFEIEEKTAEAAFGKKELLRDISRERISAELSKLLCGKDAGRILLENPEIFSVFIPEILPLRGFNQRHFRHDRDVLGHIAAVIDASPQKPEVRLAALFHDIAKPECFSVDDEGTGHFYGHAVRGAEIAEEVLRRLRFDNKTTEKVALLVRHHEDRFPPEKKAVRRLLGKIGWEAFEDLLSLMEADEAGKRKEFSLPAESFAEYRRIAGEILREGECFSLRELALSGDDLIAAGFVPGRRIGEILGILLEKVTGEELPNEREALLRFALSLK